MSRYNPMSYHNGSVWPHDNAILAAGQLRYGAGAWTRPADRHARSTLRELGGRLPELFCGFDRAEFGEPVPYPTACSPQAWAAAAPLYLLCTLLRFDPWIPFGRVWCAPRPSRNATCRCGSRGAPCRRRSTLDAREGAWNLGGLPRGIELIRKPRRPLTAGTPPHLTKKATNILTQM